MLALCAAMAFSIRGLAAESPSKPAGAEVWFRFENNLKDEFSSLTGSGFGSTAFEDGKFGRGMVFDGRSRVEISDDPRLRVQEFTIESWIRRESSSVAGPNSYGIGIIFTGSVGGYSLYLTKEGNLSMSHVGFATVYSSGQVRNTDWHHVAVTKTGTSVRFFIDGNPAGEGQFGAMFSFSGPFGIGALVAPVNGETHPFLGDLDELAIYSRALTPQEIKDVYNSGQLILTAEVSEVLLKWNSKVGETYQLQGTSTLAPGQWFDVGLAIQGTGGELVVVDRDVRNEKRLYRVIRLP